MFVEWKWTRFPILSVKKETPVEFRQRRQSGDCSGVRTRIMSNGDLISCEEIRSDIIAIIAFVVAHTRRVASTVSISRLSAPDTCREYYIYNFLRVCDEQQPSSRSRHRRRRRFGSGWLICAFYSPPSWTVFTQRELATRRHSRAAPWITFEVGALCAANLLQNMFFQYVGGTPTHSTGCLLACRRVSSHIASYAH